MTRTTSTRTRLRKTGQINAICIGWRNLINTSALILASPWTILFFIPWETVGPATIYLWLGVCWKMTKASRHFHGLPIGLYTPPRDNHHNPIQSQQQFHICNLIKPLRENWIFLPFVCSVGKLKGNKIDLCLLYNVNKFILARCTQIWMNIFQGLQFSVPTSYPTYI